MNRSSRLTSNFEWLMSTFSFMKRHFATVLALGLIAAFGRVFQLGGFGPIPAWMNIVLEVVVESARVLLFVYVLGFANVRLGLSRIKRLFSGKNDMKAPMQAAALGFKKQWRPLVFSLVGFSLVAAGINYLIDLAAYETCFYLKLKKGGILADAASEWTIILFLKNLSVIPFTLVFQALFVLWITNKLHCKTPVAL